MITFVEETKSTNTDLMQRAAAGEAFPHLYTLCTYRQTAGRGQRGNSWESEPDKNISFTTVLDSSQLAPSQLWRLNMLTAVSVADVLRTYQLPAEIKWPNDIYVGDRKICGMLIENVLQGGTICCSLAGIGVNVNQEVFVSNAPNPTSMRLLTGMTYDKKEVLRRILSALETLWPWVLHQPDELKQRYMDYLYRREGEWLWREVPVTTAPMMIDRNATPDAFAASIEGITEQGQLLLRHGDHVKAYGFKEIKYIIK